MQGDPGKTGPHGAPGDRGAPVSDDNIAFSFFNTVCFFIHTLQGAAGNKGLAGGIGPKGQPGRDGSQGRPGKPGQDGFDGGPGAPGNPGPQVRNQLHSATNRDSVCIVANINLH